MKVGIVGTGYVGLVSGTCFAELGNDVVCMDIDSDKVARLKAGKVPIYEAGLEDLLKRNVMEGRLRFTTSLKAAVDVDVVFLALPTPSDEDGSADLSYVLGVADKIGPLLKHYTVIVDKSTVPVGTAERVKEHIAKHAADSFDVVSNPEFLREGWAVHDFMEPDRIILGSSSTRAKKVMNELYAPIVRKGYPIMFMDERTAELTKYAANSFLATKITFMNQIANLCEVLGANVDSVRLGIGSDERIGHRFLFPGIGYGGSCFPKDIKALVHTATQAGYDLTLLQTVLDVNSIQQERLQQKINHYYKGKVEGKTFAQWGLAFKGDTDDVRQSPALKIIRDLSAQGARFVVYDPEAMDNAKQILGDIKHLKFAKDEYETLKHADALIIATEWPQFHAVSLARVKSLLAQPVIFDGRNIFSLEEIHDTGLYYESIGRAVVKPRGFKS